MARGKKDDPEDAYSAKLDMCLTDGIVKTGSGVLIGALTSVLFFRRRRWPIIAGMGVGIGLAYANYKSLDYENYPTTTARDAYISQ